MQLEPTNEDAHRLLISLYQRQGLRAHALRQYQLCRDSLQRELGVAPAPETQRLFEKIKAGNSRATSEPRPGDGDAGASQPLPTDQEDTLDVADNPGEKPPRHWLWLATAAVALLIAGTVWAVGWRPTANRAVALSGKPSIAVLPFVDLAGTERTERLADGLTSDIITDLARFRDLSVIAHNSTLAYKDRTPTDPQQVEREMGARYVVEGEIRTDGRTARVTARLTDAESATELWSARYVYPLDDIFALQDKVSAGIVGSLPGFNGAVAQASTAAAKRKRPGNLKAYELVLLAVEAQQKFTKEDNIKSQELARQAMALDPTFARAYVALAWSDRFEVDIGYSTSVEGSLEKTITDARTAVALDPADADAYMILGSALGYRGDYDAALAALDRALSLNPGNADIINLYGSNLTRFGRSQEGLELVQQSMHLNPHYPDWYRLTSLEPLFLTGHFQRVVDLGRPALYTAAFEHLFLALSYGELGKAAEAQAEAAEVMRLEPDYSAERQLGEQGSYRGSDLDLFLGAHPKAGLPVCSTAVQLQASPLLKRLARCDQWR